MGNHATIRTAPAGNVGVLPEVPRTPYDQPRLADLPGSAIAPAPRAAVRHRLWNGNRNGPARADGIYCSRADRAVSGGEWTTRGRQKEAREAEREQLRLEKRHLRDLRWAIERSRVESLDWADLLTLQAAHGKEGPLQLFRELVPYWRDCQRINGGADIPPDLFPQDMGIFPRTPEPVPAAPVNRTKAGKGAPRKRRSDAGKAQPSRKSQTAPPPAD